MKKILVLLGNPDANSFSGAVADKYQQAAEAEGHEVRRMNLGELSFNPILHRGYKEIQALEPDLVALQDNWRWADHTVIVYPNWWNTMPAILKGMFDRMWLPGFAFNFDKERNHKLIKRLEGKTARVIIIAGTHSPFSTWWKFGDYTNEIQHGILEFAGIKTKVTAFGPVDRSPEKLLQKWLGKVESLGKNAS
jgi:putative NADPH-quinone reductase